MIDRHVILTVVTIIGLTLLVLVIGIIHAIMAGKSIDAGVTALAGSALGYLGGLLTNISRRAEPGQPLTVPDKV